MLCGSNVCLLSRTQHCQMIQGSTIWRCGISTHSYALLALLEVLEVSQFDKESLHINCFITSNLSEAALCVHVDDWLHVQGGDSCVGEFKVRALLSPFFV